MKLTMQTALANVFAVGMAAAVLAFPSPKDMLAAIGQPDQQQTSTARDTMPETLRALSMTGLDQPDYDATFSPDHARAALTGCADYLDRAPRPDTETCRAVIEEARDAFISPTGYGPAHPEIEMPTDRALTEAMILANAQLCRAEWRKADSPSAFDLASCISTPTALALGTE